MAFSRLSGYRPRAMVGAGYHLMDSEIKEADARSKKIVESISSHANVGVWKPKMDRIVGFVLQTIGSRAVEMARGILHGSGAAGVSASAATLKALNPVSPWLRRKNTGGMSPLLDTGRLMNSLRAVVDVAGGRVMLTTTGGNTHRSGEFSMLLSDLAKKHEEGYDVTVSQKMLNYFAVLAAVSRARTNKPDKDGTTGEKAGGAKVTLTTDPTRFRLNDPGTVEAIRKMAAMKEGAIIKVPPRPFMQPALEGALKEFYERSSGAKFLRAVFGAWDGTSDGLERIE